MYEFITYWLTVFFMSLFLSMFGINYGICDSCGYDEVVTENTYGTHTYMVCEYCRGTWDERGFDGEPWY